MNAEMQHAAEQWDDVVQVLPNGPDFSQQWNDVI